MRRVTVLFIILVMFTCVFACSEKVDDEYIINDETVKIVKSEAVSSGCSI